MGPNFGPKFQRSRALLYKIVAGSAGVIWYKVLLLTVFIFEHLPVTSLLGYQIKQKVATKVESGMKTAIYKYCKII